MVNIWNIDWDIKYTLPCVSKCDNTNEERRGKKKKIKVSCKWRCDKRARGANWEPGK